MTWQTLGLYAQSMQRRKPPITRVAKGIWSVARSRKNEWCLAAFPAAGLLASFLTACFDPGRFITGRLSIPIAVAPFGALMAIGLYYFFGLRSIWKLTIFIAVSLLATLFSVVAAALVFLSLRLIRSPQADPTAFFVGGFVGCFILLVTALRLVLPSLDSAKLFLKGLSGGVVGGLLGAGGRAAAGIAHQIRISFPSLRFYGGDSDVSLLLVWQTGMGLVLAWVVSREKARHDAATHATALLL